MSQDNKSGGLQFVSPPRSGTVSASYGTKAPGMYTLAKSILGGAIAVPGRKAIANLCLLFASPVTADNTSAAVIEERVVASGYRISLGLVEISALATLIGATNAEALALGMGAAAGLPWASISTFGAMHVIKVSLAAVIPDRIREALGLRNQTVDSAIGMSLEIDPTKTDSHSVNYGAPCAILVPHHDSDNYTPSGLKEMGAPSHKAPDNDGNRRPRAVFTFGSTVATIISNLPSTGPGERLEIYQFSEDRGPDGAHKVSNDRVALISSLLKLTEVYALWRAGATLIWWVTALAWAHGFLAAIILLALGFSRVNSKLGQVDIVVGELPTPLLPGGPRKIVLGLPCNVRRHYVWKIVWGAGMLVNCLVVLCIFISLGSQTVEVVYIWVGFQTFWLVIRTLVYNFLAVGHVRRNIMVSRPWEMAAISARRRLVGLVMGLAKQQITIHPRGAFSYQEDLINATEIMRLYRTAGNRLFNVLPIAKIPHDQNTDIKIIGIVGDTVLRSSAWFQGVSVLSPDLYDCVLVFVEIEGSVFAVPSVRVLAGMPPGDVEDRISSFEPRGTSNDGHKVSWAYWIPAQDSILGHCWLEAWGMEVRKKQTGILTPKQLQTKVQGGSLNIGFTQMGDVERVLEESRKTVEALMQLLSDAELS